jgi:pyrroline-5-carboxylate reductase
VFDKISFIGCGMIAQAIMEPMISQGIQPAGKIMVYDVNVSTMQHLEQEHGVKCAESMQALVHDADLVICAVKPQNLTEAFFDEVRKGIQANPSQDSIFLSVIAGKGMDVFQHGSGCRKIVRSMPNTPATIGQGMTVWSATPNLNVEERKKIREVLSSCGKTVRVRKCGLLSCVIMDICFAYMVLVVNGYFVICTLVLNSD